MDDLIFSDMKVELIDHMGTDLSVVNAARVSFANESQWGDVNEQLLKTGDKGLIKYLAREKHYSPFNHTFISLRVKAPIFVARQLVKHEYMPWNEVSRRYVKALPEFYLPTTWRKSAANVKQGSSDEAIHHFYDEIDECEYSIDDTVKTMMYLNLTLYKSLIKSDVCPEQARMILPQNTQTEWVWSGTLKAFSKMLGLRLDSHTQEETRFIAEEVEKLIQPLFPISLPALLESERNAN